MVLPQNAKVEATPNFLVNLEAAYSFFEEQDADTAEARVVKLKADLREMVSLLAWSPAGGRIARFLNAKSIQAKLKADAVRQLAEQAELPYLREYVVSQHIVLYAHSDTDVVLLAIKHQRQISYSNDMT
jgi:hypothetical protein